MKLTPSAIFFLLLALLPLAVQAQVCRSTRPNWSTGNGNILVNGQVFHLKGTSWFGFESESHAPHGLWSKSMDHFAERLNQLQINALRLPFSVFLVLNNPSKTNVDCNANPGVCNKNALDLMGHVIDKLGDRGIMVMLDQHRLHGGPFAGIENWISELWFDNTYSEAKVLESWDVLMRRFGSKWNLMALDLKNEPRGRASWGKNNRGTDWNKAAERIIQHIGTNHPQYKGLFFVEGVASNADTPTPNSFAHWWGGNMEGVHRHPISTGNGDLDRRVVYSPHTYGPDVHNQEYFKAGDFPGNMPRIWDLHFGFVEGKTGRPIVTGEWGGKYGSGPTGHKDVQWADAFAGYMIDRCMADNFYWCLNPNSGDTGGLLNNDWSSFNEAKRRLIGRIQPNPTKLTRSGGRYCYKSGSPANSKCGGGGPPGDDDDDDDDDDECQKHDGMDVRGANLAVHHNRRESQCCSLCANNPDCKAYAWNNFRGGTCWLKTGTELFSKGGVKAGVRGSAGGGGGCSKHNGKDVAGPNLHFEHNKPERACCGLCKSRSGCRSYAWNNYKGGTCWLKTGTSLFDKSDVKAGIVN